MRDEEAKPEKARLKKTINPEDRNWLQNTRMLPSIVPRSRIFEFCYSEKAACIQNLKNLTQCFLRLLSEIKPARPKIFIAYGRGVLVLELAVMISYSKPAASSLKPPATVQETPQNGGSSPAEASKSTKDSSQTAASTLAGKGPVKETKLEIPRTKLLDFTLVAGILLLGSPREVPVTSVFKIKDLGDPKKVETQKLVEICVKTEFEKTKDGEASGSTIYHSCFERIVNEVGIATQCYQGFPGKDLPDPEAGINFRVCWPQLFISSLSTINTPLICWDRCDQTQTMNIYLYALWIFSRLSMLGQRQ